MPLLKLRTLTRVLVVPVAMAWPLVGPAAESPANTVAPALQAFVADALREHPEMQAARAELERIRAEADAADQPLYNPQLGLEYEETDITEKTLGIEQTFDWTGKREARANAAAAALVAAEARYRAAREAFVAELLTALANFEIAEQQAALAERSAKLMQRFSDIAEQRQRAGDLSQVDYDLAVLARLEADMQLARTRSRLAEAEQDLRVLTLGSAGAWPQLPRALPTLDVGAELDQLLANVPAIVAAHADAQSAAAIVALRKRQTRPDPTFGLRGGKEGEENLIGFSVSIPLFVRNSYGAELAAARAGERAAMQNAAAIEREVRAQIIAAGRRYENVRDAWQGWSAQGETSLNRQMDVLERLWRAGELGTTDYLVQLKQALDTNAGALDLRNELWTAWFDWLEASARATEWIGIAANAPTTNELP